MCVDIDRVKENAVTGINHSIIIIYIYIHVHVHVPGIYYMHVYTCTLYVPHWIFPCMLAHVHIDRILHDFNWGA